MCIFGKEIKLFFFLQVFWSFSMLIRKRFKWIEKAAEKFIFCSIEYFLQALRQKMFWIQFGEKKYNFAEFAEFIFH
jgi:hypothetical protein